MPGKSLLDKRKSLWFWIAFFAAAVLITVLLYSETFRQLVDGATAWARVIMNDHPITGAAVFFLFAALSAMLAFASSAVLVAPANLVWGKLITFLLLWGGWIAGAIAAFGIGRVARPLLVRLGYQEKLHQYQQFVSRRMKFWTAILFCMAVPSEIPGYLLGGLRYPFLKFVGAIAIAEAIYAFGITIAGQSLVASKPLPLIATVAALILMVMVSRWLLHRLKHSKSNLDIG